VILSGDAPHRVDALAAAIGARGLGGLAPDAKAREVDRMRASGGPVALLADGANDSIALARADVSIVVDRKLEWLADGADLVLMGDRVAALPELVALARRARRRVVGALSWAAAYHAVTLTLGALGMLGPAQAALWMALGSVAVVHAGTRPLATPPAERDPFPPIDPESAPRAAAPRNVASAAGACAR
jgi:Cu2+-exporting ATPase